MRQMQRDEERAFQFQLQLVNSQTEAAERARENQTREPSVEETLLQVVNLTQELMDKLKDVCPICLESFVVGEIGVTCPKCNRLHHKEGMLKNVKLRNTCPSCRHIVLKDNVDLNINVPLANNYLSPVPRIFRSHPLLLDLYITIRFNTMLKILFLMVAVLLLCLLWSLNFVYVNFSRVFA